MLGKVVTDRGIVERTNELTNELRRPDKVCEKKGEKDKWPPADIKTLKPFIHYLSKQGRTTKIGQEGGGGRNILSCARENSPPLSDSPPPGHDFCPLWASFSPFLLN